MKKLCLILAIALLLVACAGPTPTAPPPLAEGYDEYIEEPDYSYEVFEDYLMDEEYLPEEDDYPELAPDIPVEGPPLQTCGQAIPEQPQAQGGSPQHCGAMMPEEPTQMRPTGRVLVVPDVPASDFSNFWGNPPPVITMREAYDIAIDHIGYGWILHEMSLISGRLGQAGVFAVVFVRHDDEYVVWIAADTGEIVHTERLR